MSARTRVVLLGVSALLAACGAVDPCDGQSGTCVGVTLTGSIGAVDAIRVDISGATMHGFTSRLATASELPIAVPMLLKATVKGTLQVSAAASSGGGVVALGNATVTIVSGGRASVEIVMTKVAGASCTDKARDGNESDVDCGGSCPPCVDGKLCGKAADCAGGVCTGGRCVAASCMDGAKNGKETDQDCGGGGCPACDDGKTCAAATDCKSGRCNAMNICEAPSCMDGAKNGDETDLDCGGPCPACVDGLGCARNGDCKSQVCDPMSHTCSAPSCIDKSKNGSETDVDCGGPCMPCGAGKACIGDGDCISKTCLMGSCLDGNCMDGQKNGSETDLDCGGNRCMPCNAGRFCQMASDCISTVCTGGTCRAPTCMDGVKNGMETDTDCGGNCPRCKDGSACKVTGDCVSTNCKANRCEQLFAAKSVMLNNGAARNVEVADVNGDKVPDVITVLGMSSQVAVMLGDGMGGFAATRYFPTGANSGPVGIAVCDFNRDGKLDVVTSGYGNNSVSVLTGDGAGAFVLGVTVPTQTGPWYVACGELLPNATSAVTTNYTANSVTVAYSANAPGGVNPQHVSTTNPSPRSVALLDYNKDTFVDGVVVENGFVELLQNDRMGRLVRQTALRTLGGCNDNLTVADLNGDGWLDVVATNSCNGGNLDAFLSNKVSGFLNAARVDNGNAQTVAVAAGDFSGDNAVDLITNGAGFSLSVLIGMGNGTFAPANKQDSAGQPLTSLRVADFNKDGKLDVVGANNTTSVVVLLNNR